MKASSNKNGTRRMLTYRYFARIIKNHKAELAEKYKVKEIGIFGSYVRGEQHKRSDLDILVDFEEVPDFFTFIRMERYGRRRCVAGKRLHGRPSSDLRICGSS